MEEIPVEQTQQIEETEPEVEPVQETAYTVDETVQPNGDTYNLVLKQTDVTIICGRRGSGKSTLASQLIKALIYKRCPLKIIDPLKEHLEFSKKGVDVVYLEYGEPTQMDNFLQSVYGTWKGIIVIDEADGFLPAMKTLTPFSKKLLHLSRHYGIGVILITRRLSNLHTDTLAQAKHVFVFGLNSPADFDFLSRGGMHEIVENMSQLERYEFFYFNFDDHTLIHSPALSI